MKMGRSKVGRVGEKKQCDFSERVKPRRHGEDERTNEKQAEAQRGRVCCDWPLNNRFFILGEDIFAVNHLSLPSAPGELYAITTMLPGISSQPHN